MQKYASTTKEPQPYLNRHLKLRYCAYSLTSTIIPLTDNIILGTSYYNNLLRYYFTSLHKKHIISFYTLT